jgi:hypothetical protein
MPENEPGKPCGRLRRLLHGTLERAAEVSYADHEGARRVRLTVVSGTPDAQFAYFHVQVEAPSSSRTRAPLSTSGSKLVALTATEP